MVNDKIELLVGGPLGTTTFTNRQPEVNPPQLLMIDNWLDPKRHMVRRSEVLVYARVSSVGTQHGEITAYSYLATLSGPQENRPVTGEVLDMRTLSEERGRLAEHGPMCGTVDGQQRKVPVADEYQVLTE